MTNQVSLFDLIYYVSTPMINEIKFTTSLENFQKVLKSIIKRFGRKIKVKFYKNTDNQELSEELLQIDQGISTTIGDLVDDDTDMFSGNRI